MPAMYGTLDLANTYFSTRLHSTLWTNSSSTNKTNALYKATEIIDALNFKGSKATVYATLLADEYALQSTLRVAEAAQELEFPRDADTTVPDAILRACYEIAFSLLDGVDPDLELENIAITSQGYAGVKTTYNREQQPIEHIINGIPSPMAWRLLKPFLRDSNSIKFSRI